MLIEAATRVPAALQGDELLIPGGIQAEPGRTRVGDPWHQEGLGWWGLQVLSPSKSCQICPLPSTREQPGPVAVRQPETDIV